ncbi:MAG: radical SAM protein [Elusimicrobia bacterium]|nr:radical SAM protein [Elusimicrobiota bacterium]
MEENPGEMTLPAEGAAALREHLIGPLLSHKLIASPSDKASTESWLRAAFRVIHRLSLSPFSTQEAIAKDLGIRKEELIALNGALRDSDLAQQLIVDRGQGTKYWRNTLLPIIEAGAMEAASENRFQFPHRISIFAGPSCMFYCSFCGRNRSAAYESATIPSGNEAFKALLRDAPKGDPERFFISGGLEPLTNPRIGDLVGFGARQGYRLSLYTNAFMLTPQFVSRQAGLWDLDALRISFFGVDEERTFEVTKRRGAFGQVVRNITEFLKLRKARNAPLKVGLNFVVLPGHAKDVLELAEVIAGINRQVGGDRQLDFVTLREDFNTPEDEAIAPEERKELVSVFAELRERRKRPDLCRLHVDFGYALQPIEQGAVPPSGGIVMAGDCEIRGRGFPQVCVVIDLLGDVYIYREAGFLDRPGARRYVIGRISTERSLEAVIRDFLSSGRSVAVEPGDWRYLDAFDHVVVKFLNQMDADRAFGIPLRSGPIRL